MHPANIQIGKQGENRDHCTSHETIHYISHGPVLRMSPRTLDVVYHTSRNNDRKNGIDKQRRGDFSIDRQNVIAYCVNTYHHDYSPEKPTKAISHFLERIIQQTSQRISSCDSEVKLPRVRIKPRHYSKGYGFIGILSAVPTT